FDKSDNFIADHRNGVWIDIGRNVTGATERSEVANQSVAGDVGGGANEIALGQVGADGIDLRHEPNDAAFEGARCESFFNRGRGDAGAKWFSQDERRVGKECRS